MADAVVTGYLTERAASGQVNERDLKHLDYDFSHAAVADALRDYGRRTLLAYSATVDELALVAAKTDHDPATYHDADTSIYRLLEERLADQADAVLDADAATPNQVRQQEYADQQAQFAFAGDAWIDIQDQLSLVRQGGYMTVSYTPTDGPVTQDEWSAYQVPAAWEVDQLL